MATLSDAEGRIELLRPHHLIGRSRSMHTRVPDQEVSAQHAAILWTGEGWFLKDLGSRNGTFLDGRRLPAGELAPLRAGTSLAFGGLSRVFTLGSDAPPAASARRGDVLVEGNGDYLALPTEDDPAVLIAFEPGAGWVLSDEERATPITDGQGVDVGGERWVVSLPEAITATRDAGARRLTLADCALRFRVSADEEYVELTVLLGGEAHPLKPRAHHYTLLVLARARLGEPSGTPEAERGWLYTADLARMLRVSRNQLYVGFHRARKEIEALGLEGAGLVEKRSTTRQLRVGVADLAVDAI